MSTGPIKNMIGVMSTSLRESCTHHPPTHPPSDAAHEGVADVGGVIGQQTRDTDYTRFTQEVQSAQNGSRQPQLQEYRTTAPIAYAVDSGAGTSTEGQRHS
jgi:hypothetical protein